MIEDQNISVAYFKQRKGYDRIFRELRKKWKRNGKCSGTIRLEQSTQQEREALQNLLGRRFDDVNISFTFQEFEEAYRRSRIYSVSFAEILEMYFNETLVTNKESKEQKAKQKQLFYQNLIEKTAHLAIPEAASFFIQLSQGNSIASSFASKEYARSPIALQCMMIYAWEAVAYLMKEAMCRLAVLSTSITGNPHYFDRNLTSGKALLYVLSFYYDVAVPKHSEEILKLYDLAGIVTDEISNFTTAFGVHLYDKDGVHPAFEAFLNRKEPYLVSSYHLNQMVKATANQKIVYAVENQMLYSHLCEVLRDTTVAIICTSGQPKTASLLMLDLLCNSGHIIYYAGDLDPEGILIADRLITRNPKYIYPWHFTVEDYQRSLSNENLSESRLKQLDHISNPYFQPLCESIKQQKKAGYQEALLEVMLEDMKKGMYQSG